MASFNLIGPPQFPNGTSVAVYPRSNWNGPVVTTAAPVGSATETKTVTAGVAAYVALASDTRYVAYALVGGVHKYTRFSTLTSPSADSGSGLALNPTAVKTANYTAVASDFVPVDTTSGNVTVTLPTAPADKTVVAVKHVIQGSTNTVTIARGGSDVFNKAGGSTSLTFAALNQAVLLEYKATGAIWYVVAADIPNFSVLADVHAATALVDGNDLYYDAVGALVKGRAPRIVATAVGNLGTSKTIDLNNRLYSIFTCAVDQATCDLTLSNIAAGAEWRIELTNASGGSRTVTLQPGAVAVAVAASTTVTVVGSSPNGVLLQQRQVGASASTAGTLVGYCSLTLNAATAVLTAGTAIPWDVETADPQGMHAASATTVVVPTAAGAAAVAHIQCTLSVNLTSGTRILQLRKNGVAIRPRMQSFESDGTNARKELSHIIPCAAADTFDVVFSGQNGNAQPGETESVFSISVFKSP